MFPFIYSVFFFPSWIVTVILQSLFSGSAGMSHSSTQLMLNEREWLHISPPCLPTISHAFVWCKFLSNKLSSILYCVDGQNRNMCTSTRLTLLFMHQPLMMFGLGSKQQWTTLWLIQKWDRGVGAEERKDNPPMYSGTMNIGSPDWNGGSF